MMAGQTRGGRWLLLVFVVAVSALLTASCASTDTSVGPAGPAAAPVGESPQFSGFVAATEFVVGDNRFPFALLSVDGQPLEGAQVQVGFYSLEKEPPELRSRATAEFREVKGVTPHRHADGTIHDHLDVKGVYVVGQVSFDRPGYWGAEFAVTAAGGERPKVQGAAFAVVAQPKAPGVGERVPPSRNLTLSDVGSIEEIESRVPPDDMHELSVAQALEEGRPLVVVFATPMFCISRMCGPVTDMAVELHGRFKDRVSFVHIEPWDLGVARSEGRLVPTDVMLEWSLPSEPWVFVVDPEGRVAARFEGLVTSEELEQAILTTINTAGAR